MKVKYDYCQANKSKECLCQCTLTSKGNSNGKWPNERPKMKDGMGGKKMINT